MLMDWQMPTIQLKTEVLDDVSESNDSLRSNQTGNESLCNKKQTGHVMPIGAVNPM